MADRPVSSQAAVTIRPESPGDAPAIDEVVRFAFARDDEADLVARLRAAGDLLLSLVAAEGDFLVGHALFCPLEIRTAAGLVPAVGLAPLSVRPSHQRRGIGGRLVRDGLAALAAGGHHVVAVLGHPEYYARFGFSAEAAVPLRVPFAGPAWLALELTPGGLAGVAGPVAYPPAFGIAT